MGSMLSLINKRGQTKEGSSRLQV